MKVHWAIRTCVCVKAVLSWNEISGFWISSFIVEWWHDLLTLMVVALQQFGTQRITNSLQQVRLLINMHMTIQSVPQIIQRPMWNPDRNETAIKAIQPKFCRPTSVYIYHGLHPTLQITLHFLLLFFMYTNSYLAYQQLQTLVVCQHSLKTVDQQ